MKYRKLNEVLIEWNNSYEGDSNNTFLKSEDIKEFLDSYFVYRLDKKEKIKIFNADARYSLFHWPEYDQYKNKVLINGKHIELDDEGYTIDIFEPGEYKVYIEDIDKLTNTNSMFYKCEQLVSAFIPDSVTSIDGNAFRCCARLTSVTIGNSVISIGWSALRGCRSLTSVTIPNSVTTISSGAFCRCTNLTSVTISDSVTEIGSSAFEGCSDLISIEIPNSVTIIGGSAFADCTSLKSVTIPNSVTFIYDGAFYNCRNLKTVYVEDINKFKQIQFEGKQSNPARTKKVKVIELKK